MNKKEQLILIEKTWGVIKKALHKHTGLRDLAKEYLALEITKERHHRRTTLAITGEKTALTVNQAAKLFCVRTVAEYIKIQGLKLDAELYINLKPSLYFGYSLAYLYRNELTQALNDAGIDLQAVINIQYNELT